MENLVWLLDSALGMGYEATDTDNEYARLKAAIKNNGGSICELGYRVQYEPSSDDEINLAYGSIGFIQRLRKYNNPGPWCNWEAMKCTSYYPAVGKYLLNKDYVMIPVGDIARKMPELLRRFKGKMFIRPNSGNKCFSGFVFDGNVDHFMYRHMLHSCVDELAVVSSCKTIDAEWRVFCTNERLISWSLYKEKGMMKMEHGCNVAVSNICKDVIEALYPFPDPIFVLDICKSEGSYHLLEMGSFSCAGMYDCDVNEIVRIATEIAIEDHNEIFYS